MDELLRSGQLFLTEAMSEPGDHVADERRMLGIANAHHLAAIANALAGKSAAEADAAALERMAVEAVDQAAELAEELRRTRAKLAKARRKQGRAEAAEAAIERVLDLARRSQRRGAHAGLLSAHSVLEALDGAE